MDRVEKRPHDQQYARVGVGLVLHSFTFLYLDFFLLGISGIDLETA